MSFWDKFVGCLKMAGLGLALACGTVCEAIGIPLFFVGQDKQAQAHEEFTSSEQYAIVREAEDLRLEKLKEKADKVEEQYANGEIFSSEYNSFKSEYDADVKDSKENFEQKAFDKYATADIKAMDKSGYASKVSSIVLMSLGGLAYLIKAGMFIYRSIDWGEATFIGADIIDTMGDVIEYDFALSDEEIRAKEEKKRLKEEKKKEELDKEFIEEDEEKLKNIEDDYYKE